MLVVQVERGRVQFRYRAARVIGISERKPERRRGIQDRAAVDPADLDRDEPRAPNSEVALSSLIAATSGRSTTRPPPSRSARSEGSSKDSGAIEPE